MEDNKIEGLLTKVLNEESSIKKISVSVASAVIAASIIGSIVLYKEFIHIQDWASHHEELIQVHIARIGTLEFEIDKGGRWTLEDHNKYFHKESAKNETLVGRVSALERSTDLMEYKLTAMDGKLDNIVRLLNAAVISRKEAREIQSMSGM